MIAEVLRHLATHVATLLVEKRLESGALSPGILVEGREVWRLRYSTTYRVLWSAMTVVWGTAVVLFSLAVWWPAREDWRLLLPVALFGAALSFSARAARDGYTQEIEVSSWGLTERRGGSVVASFPWEDVVRVEFVTHLDSYRLTPRQGPAVHVGMHIQGIPRLKWCTRTHVPADALEGVRDRIADLGRL